MGKVSQNNYLSKREVYQIIKEQTMERETSQNNYLSKREVYKKVMIGLKKQLLVSK